MNYILVSLLQAVVLAIIIGVQIFIWKRHSPATLTPVAASTQTPAATPTAHIATEIVPVTTPAAAIAVDPAVPLAGPAI